MESKSEPAPFSISQELAALRKVKQTQNKQHLHRLPPNARIQRRPINHAPIASPYAGPSVAKIVYVSKRTPLMSAVKRVQKLLHHIEKRAMRSVSMTRKEGKGMMKDLAEASAAMDNPEQREVVMVKASGRAMGQALRVGEWFRNRETGMICRVEVKTGSVSVVDDIVELENEEEEGDEILGIKNAAQKTGLAITEDVNSAAVAFTALESSSLDNETNKDAPTTDVEEPKPIKSRKRKKRPMYDKDDLPEARIRWIKTVEVTISLKG